MKKRTKPYKRKLLPYATIEAATKGDQEAMDEVLAHYSGYITALCRIAHYGEKGEYRAQLDHDLRTRLENKLIQKTLGFRLTLSRT